MGSSGPILVLVLGLMFAGLCFGITNFALNQMVDVINDQTDMGIRSEDSRSFLEFVFNLWKFAPLAIVIGTIVYTYEVAKGSQLEAITFFEYVAALYVGAFMAIILLWGWGMTVDLIFDNLISQPTIGNVDPIWDRTGVVANIMISVYYMISFVSIVPLILMIIFPILSQRDNTIFEFEDNGRGGNGGNSEAMTEYQPQQWG